MLLRYDEFEKNKLTEFDKDVNSKQCINLLDNSVPLVFWLQFAVNDIRTVILYMMESYSDDIIKRSIGVFYCGEQHWVYLNLENKLCKYNLQTQHLMIGSMLDISITTGKLYFDHFKKIIWASKYWNINPCINDIWKRSFNPMFYSYNDYVAAYDMTTLQYIENPIDQENCTILYDNEIISQVRDYLASSNKRINLNIRENNVKISGGIVHRNYHKITVYDFDLNIIKKYEYNSYCGNRLIWLEYKKARDEKWDPLENCPIEKNVRIVFDNVEFGIPRWCMT